VTPQSTVVFGQQMQNVSQGRSPDGDTNAVHSMVNWTPRAPNALGPILAFTGISLDPNGVRLVWSAIPGRSYRVDSKPVVDAPEWTPVSAPIVAGGPLAEFTDTPVTPGQRFYRVTLLR